MLINIGFLFLLISASISLVIVAAAYAASLLEPKK